MGQHAANLTSIHGGGPIDNPQVDTPSTGYRTMVSAWDRADALQSTERMRSSGTKYLPENNGEENLEWEARRDRTFLLTSFRDAILKTVARPFSRPVQIAGEDNPDIVDEVAKDMDLAGASLHDFAHDAFEDCVRYGKCHVFVDFPNNPERSITKRPYCILYSPRDVLAWRHERDADGEDKLTHLRVRTRSIEAKGDWGEVAIDQIKVYDAPLDEKKVQGQTTFRTFTQEEGKDTWVEDTTEKGTGVLDYPGIPFITIYTNKLRFFVATSPFDDLGWLNIRHWQTTSEQNNILHIARVPILVEAGVPETKGGPRTIGSGRRIRTPGPQEAKIYYAEHSGRAIDSGFKDIETLEIKMLRLGSEAFEQREKTATGERIDDSKSSSQAQQWVMSLEQGFKRVFEAVQVWDQLKMGESLREGLPEDFGVVVWSDFQDIGGGVNDQSLDAGRARGDVSQRTWLGEMQRGGKISETVDIDEEIQATQDEIQPPTPPPIPTAKPPEVIDGDAAA